MKLQLYEDTAVIHGEVPVLLSVQLTLHYISAQKKQHLSPAKNLNSPNVSCKKKLLQPSALPTETPPPPANERVRQHPVY